MGKDKAKPDLGEDLILTANIVHPQFLLLNDTNHKDLMPFDSFQGKAYHLSRDETDIELILHDNATQNIKFIRKRIFMESYNQKYPSII